jgi:hypothetical protein
LNGNPRSDRSLVVVANGPSANDADLARLCGVAGIDLLAINTPHPAIPLNDYAYWLIVDSDVLNQRHPRLVALYQRTLITPCRCEKQHVIDFKVLSGFGFSRDPLDGFFVGRSSSYVALQFAIGGGWGRVAFFGLDMQSDDPTWFYGSRSDNPFNLPHQRAAKFDREAAFWEDAIANHLTEEERGRVWLCGLADRPFTKYFRRLAPSKAVGELVHAHTIIV